MAKKFSQGIYVPANPEKYIGEGQIIFRSSWENRFMYQIDHNPSILKWASESIRIPYIDPFTGRKTHYVPDFYIQYVDKNMVIHNEIIEIKPKSQHLREHVGKSQVNKYQYIKNQCKWKACEVYCQQNGLVFRILNEDSLFHTGKK